MSEKLSAAMSSSSEEEEEREKRKRKRKSTSSDADSSAEKKRKKAKKKERKKRKKEKKHRKEKSDVPISFMSKTMAPMTKEEWDKKQSTVRRVFDESTGRHRLIKGDGEVIEEIVSRDKHREINKQATKGDGDFFQASVYKK